MMEYILMSCIGFLLGAGLILFKQYKSRVTADLRLLKDELTSITTKVDKAISSIHTLIDKK